VLQENGHEPRTIRLDIRRAERQQALDSLGGDGGPGGPAPPQGDEGPRHFGVDGRPATIVQIKYD
jgi:hypothetical protein